MALRRFYHHRRLISRLFLRRCWDREKLLLFLHYITCLIFKREAYMKWDGKRVLVTGGGGFIGSHLVERLVGLGARVRVLVRYNARNDWGLLELLPQEIKENLEVVMGDLSDPFGTARALQDCSMVFHLAALIAIP